MAERNCACTRPGTIPPSAASILQVVDSARPNESLDLQVAAVALNHTAMLVSFEGDFLISGCP